MFYRISSNPDLYLIIMVEPGIEKLKCKACGAGLHIEAGADIIKCDHCSTEYRVQEHDTGIGRPIALEDNIYLRSLRLIITPIPIRFD